MHNAKTMTKSTDSAPEAEQTPASFEQALAELESLVVKMDQPDMGLDVLLGDYKRGAKLVKYCRDRLKVVKSEMARIESDLQDSEGGE